MKTIHIINEKRFKAPVPSRHSGCDGEGEIEEMLPLCQRVWVLDPGAPMQEVLRSHMIRCKRSVCEKCSPHKAYTIKPTGLSKKLHKLCNFCKEENDALKKFVE